MLPIIPIATIVNTIAHTQLLDATPVAAWEEAGDDLHDLDNLLHGLWHWNVLNLGLALASDAKPVRCASVLRIGVGSTIRLESIALDTN